jgi:hypothetical protein
MITREINLIIDLLLEYNQKRNMEIEEKSYKYQTLNSNKNTTVGEVKLQKTFWTRHTNWGTTNLLDQSH